MFLHLSSQWNPWKLLRVPQNDVFKLCLVQKVSSWLHSFSPGWEFGSHESGLAPSLLTERHLRNASQRGYDTLRNVRTSFPFGCLLLAWRLSLLLRLQFVSAPLIIFKKANLGFFWSVISFPHQQVEETCWFKQYKKHKWSHIYRRTDSEDSRVNVGISTIASGAADFVAASTQIKQSVGNAYLLLRASS